MLNYTNGHKQQYATYFSPIPITGIAQDITALTMSEFSRACLKSLLSKKAAAPFNRQICSASANFTGAGTDLPSSSFDRDLESSNKKVVRISPFSRRKRIYSI
jgi:hypothetical protein